MRIKSSLSCCRVSSASWRCDIRIVALSASNDPYRVPHHSSACVLLAEGLSSCFFNTRTVTLR